MKVATILDHIDSGHMALPEFQRGYVWNRDQVRGLMDSLYRKHPVGSLLVWATQSNDATHRGDHDLAAGVVKLLLDGQQRITSLYGIIRGKPPQFFDGHAEAFTGLRFHLESEEFSFYQPIRMKDDPLWVDVTALLQVGIGGFLPTLLKLPEVQPRISEYVNRLNQIEGIKTIDLHIEEVTGPDKTIDVVVDIFNRVNSGGTKLSQGDLALAKVCASWPDARAEMKRMLGKWRKLDLHFDLDWLLRNANTVTTGEARFNSLHDIDAATFKTGLARAEKAIDHVLTLVSGRLGLDHDRVLFARYAFPVMTHYIDRRGGKLADARERDRLLFWYLNSALWGRFSSSTESYINSDLETLKELDGGLDRLIKELRLWRGDLTVKPDHFGGWSLGARFYPMLYLMTRMGEARDWGSGLPLKHGILGKLSSLQVHHIFPKARLYKAGYRKDQVNAVANYCFLTQESNLEISARDPREYFEEVDKRFPGALASQWIPMQRELWQIDRYPEFLEARKLLLAATANQFLGGLAHETETIAPPTIAVMSPPAVTPEIVAAAPVVGAIPGGIESDEEERAIAECNAWVVAQGLPEGTIALEVPHPVTGEPLAVLDLAWPNGLQEGLSQPVALLLGEAPETLKAANQAGYRYFTTVGDLRRHISHEVLANELAG